MEEETWFIAVLGRSGLHSVAVKEETCITIQIGRRARHTIALEEETFLAYTVGDYSLQSHIDSACVFMVPRKNERNSNYGLGPGQIQGKTTALLFLL